MPYYAAMAAIGSLAGAWWLYLLAKKGGEAFFHSHAGGSAEKIKEWVDGHGFLSAFIPAILPPPFPFKLFVLAEGVFQVPARTFIVAILLGRGLRYGVEGILAVRYGDAALRLKITWRRFRVSRCLPHCSCFTLSATLYSALLAKRVIFVHSRNGRDHCVLLAASLRTKLLTHHSAYLSPSRRVATMLSAAAVACGETQVAQCESVALRRRAPR